jgi:hypothetical protein
MTELKFEHISVGRDGSIWAAGETDGTIFRLFGDAGLLGWVPDKVGKAEIVAAVDRGNAWCVNKDHEIWQLVNADSLDKGGKWTQIPTHSGQADASTISVGRNDTIWYTRTDGTIFRTAAPGDGTNMPFWVQDKRIGKASVVAAVDSKTAWCVNKDHEIWLWQDGEWIQIPAHNGRADASTISIGNDGSVWYGSTAGAIFRHTQPGDGVSLPPWMQDTSWDPKRMGHADVISVNTRGDVWCLNKNGQVWRTFGRKWQQVVERGPDEKVWTYKIKPGDGLMAIVRRKFNLKDPQDTQEINRLVDLIVAQNRGITRDRIKAGDVLTLRY